MWGGWMAVSWWGGSGVGCSIVALTRGGRGERKQAVTAVSSSRWAGAITRAVDDQFQLGMRALAAQVTDLRAAVQVLEARCALWPGELAAADGDDGGSGRRSRRRGYRSVAERFAKTR